MGQWVRRKLDKYSFLKWNGKVKVKGLDTRLAGWEVTKEMVLMTPQSWKEWLERCFLAWRGAPLDISQLNAPTSGNTVTNLKQELGQQWTGLLSNTEICCMCDPDSDKCRQTNPTLHMKGYIWRSEETKWRLDPSVIWHSFLYAPLVHTNATEDAKVV